MSSTRREFLVDGASVASLSALPRKDTNNELSGLEIASRHQIVRDFATPDFFEGMLLGNGDIGVCITVRPDALGLHIGKSDAWDIRVSEEHDSQVLSFPDFLALWQRASAEAKRTGKAEVLYLEREIPFFREYTDKVSASYSKSWPRPWPCGILWVHWDASRFRIVRQMLDPSCGHYSLHLNVAGRSVRIHAFVNTSSGHLGVWSDGPVELDAVVYYPNLDDTAHLPAPRIDGNASDTSADFSVYQLFPATAPTRETPDPPASSRDRSLQSLGSYTANGSSKGWRKLRSS